MEFVIVYLLILPLLLPSLRIYRYYKLIRSYDYLVFLLIYTSFIGLFLLPLFTIIDLGGQVSIFLYIILSYYVLPLLLFIHSTRIRDDLKSIWSIHGLIIPLLIIVIVNLIFAFDFPVPSFIILIVGGSLGSIFGVCLIVYYVQHFRMSYSNPSLIDSKLDLQAIPKAFRMMAMLFIMNLFITFLIVGSIDNLIGEIWTIGLSFIPFMICILIAYIVWKYPQAMLVSKIQVLEALRLYDVVEEHKEPKDANSVYLLSYLDKVRKLVNDQTDDPNILSTINY